MEAKMASAGPLHMMITGGPKLWTLPVPTKPILGLSCDYHKVLDTHPVA